MTEFIRTSRTLTNDTASLQDAAQSVSNQGTSHPVACWISFGGNIGDVKATFDAALALLSLHRDILLGLRSSIYSTLPMGTQAGSPFLNSVCGLTTQLFPRELLTVLQSVETQLGRLRDVRWGPRTLDLDLLNYGNHFVCDPDLIVPHAALTHRRFVLDPLVEVDPDWCHPASCEPAGRIVKRLNLRPLRVSLLDVLPQQIDTLATQLQPRFPHLKLVPPSKESEDALLISTTSPPCHGGRTIVDLRHSPGDILEQLTSAFTAIFDAPERISAW